MCGKLRFFICFCVVACFLIPMQAEAADPTLVGWWKFEEASGILYDQSDYGNHGTGNGVTYQQPGQDGYALGFDGVNDIVTVGANGRPSNTFTFGGWFKTSSTHEVEAESIAGTGGTAGQRYAFEPAHGGDSDGGAGLSIGTNGISVYEHGSNYMPAPAVYAAEIGDEWNHIMVVYSSKRPTIYLNGEAVRTGLVSPRAIVHAPVVLGGMAYGYFEGLMDEVRIYNRALSQSEIAELAVVLRATGPSPPDGSNAPPDYYGDNIYMVLDYVPGYGAITHTAYFSDNFDDVKERSAAHSLGNVPPWPELSPTAFVAGYDDPAIPEYARSPLVGGRTYYWCIDEFDGSDTWPGDVWSFTVMPKQAWGPAPADGESLVPGGGTMTWNLGDLKPAGLMLSYNVYIGTDESAVAGVATGDTSSPMYAGKVGTESFDYADLEPETEHFWRVDTSLALIRPPFTATITKGDVWSFTTGPAGIGGILREWWIGMGGTAIVDLTSDPNYPNNPDGSEIVNSFEGPTNWQDDAHPYGSRLHGWLYVVTAGYYQFWIATDDNGEFWLSTDMNPGNAALVSQCTAWAPARAFDDPDVIPSFPIYLEGGRMYYVMGLMKEHGGGDNIAVAWQGPDSGGVREIIPGKHLIPYSPVVASNPNPPHRSVDAPLDVTLSWTGGQDQRTGIPYATQHVYVGSSAAAVANATTASPEYRGAPTGPNEYGPLSLNFYEQVYWRVDGENEDGVVQFPGSVWTFKALYDIDSVCDPNLRLWLAFEDDVLDSSGYARDGTAYGGPTYVAGADGQAILFDGIDDYVNIEAPVGISGDQPRTIAGWAKASTTAISDWATVFGFCPPYEANYQYFDIEKIGGGNQYGVHVHGEQWGLIDVDLEWHHFAVTYEPGFAAAYVDGVELFSLDTTGYALSTADVVRVGHRPSQNAYFPGTVDDVRIYDVAVHPTVVILMMRIDLDLAWGPGPYHGATDVPPDQILSWTHGDGATMSTVYFGKDDPANMVQVAGPQAATTYNPGPLDLGTTYYWKIVENNTKTKARVPCQPSREPFIWRFTTAQYLAVDNMEAYKPWTDPFGPWIFVSWRDGFGDCTPGNGNNTGAVLTEDTTNILRGLQSMKFDFDNDGAVYSPCTLGQVTGRELYSKIEAQVATLPSSIGSDWTAGGVKALTINFMGQAGNSTTDDFWVQLQDSSKAYGTKVYYGDQEGEYLADFNDPSWHEWNIDLADFDVDLTNVVSIVIGIGDEDATLPGSSGTIYIDEIRLYVPRCIPDRAKPAADFDNSCKVDYPDVAVLFDNWLLQNLPEDVWAKAAWTSTDIGDVNVPGSFTDFGGGSYSITARGADIWGASDSFHYAYKPLSGDGQMTVRITDITGPSANDWRKAGIMIRETLEPNSDHAFMCITPAGGGGSSFQWRSVTDGDNNNQDGPAGVTMPQCIRLLRLGDEFRAFRHVGGEWVQHGNPVIVPMAQDVYIGLAVTSHEANFSCTATFDRVCSEDSIPMDLIEDDVVNFEDYADLLNHWLEQVFWP